MPQPSSGPTRSLAPVGPDDQTAQTGARSRERAVTTDRQAIDLAGTGGELHSTVAELYPICRSITGDGVRETLARLQRIVPLEVHEVPSGTAVLDWEVPREWNIRDAWIDSVGGERLVDFRHHNLHVVGYSTPIRRRVSRVELLEHLHSLPNQAELIPYRTSYYREQWGFCVPHRLLETLNDPEYDVCIDSTLANGALTYGEVFIRGALEEEILLSCHVCHPSLANDNLSGVSIAAFVARHLSALSLRYSYRFLFIPSTIGAITWLARNESRLSHIHGGLVLAGLGDAGPLTYKRSQQGTSDIDRIVAHVLAHSGMPVQLEDFSPYGYDERQFCSPGFDLPVGRLSRTPFNQYREYHTSADDLNFVTPASLAESYAVLLAIVDAIEANRVYVNLKPKGEPQLGRRGLYQSIGGPGRASAEMAMLWVLNQSDGSRSLVDIATRARLPFELIRDAARLLEQQDLLASK
jgi:aminopeptidase-like protein